jgi:hypothetical protein
MQGRGVTILKSSNIQKKQKFFKKKNKKKKESEKIWITLRKLNQKNVPALIPIEKYKDS